MLVGVRVDTDAAVDQRLSANVLTSHKFLGTSHLPGDRGETRNSLRFRFSPRAKWGLQINLVKIIIIVTFPACVNV